MNERVSVRMPRHRTAVITVAYALLGSLLVGTRFVGLDRSYSHDEINTVTDFVAGGPGAILAGAYMPNNHELFSMLGWASRPILGESEFGLRLWSVVPFVLGVIVVAVWLHRRVDTLTAALFLALSTLSPLLLDLTRQARGYGLAFLAMGVLIVAAFEADRSGETCAVAAVALAGVAGTLTLPNFVLAYLATIGVLLGNRMLRRSAGLAAACSMFAIGAWYAPHVADLLENSRQRFGAPIPWYGVITAPVEVVLAPGMLWIDGSTLTGSVARLPLVLVLVLTMAASPLLRQPRAATLLGAGVVVTMFVLCAARTWVSPRFVSYLLVPLYVATANGLAHLVSVYAGRTHTLLRVALAATVLGLAVVAFVEEGFAVLRLPREAHREAIRVAQRELPGGPIVAYTHHRTDLEFYLGRRVQRATPASLATRVCDADKMLVFITQPFGTLPVRLPCMHRTAVRHWRLEQYARGGRIDVWLIPPAHA